MREGLGITVSLTVDSRPYELTVVSLTRDGGTTVPGDTTYDTVSVTFNDVQRSDAGVYILTSSNTAGEGSVSFTLNVECKLQLKCTVHACTYMYVCTAGYSMDAIVWIFLHSLIIYPSAFSQHS